MKDNDKRLTPIMLYTATTLYCLGAFGSWYFFFNPSGYKYSTANGGLTTIVYSITIFRLLSVVGFTIVCLYFINISENKLSTNFWFFLMILHILYAASKHSPIEASQFSLRLVRASMVTLEFILFSVYLFIYKKDDINLFGKFDVLKKKKHNNALL